MGALIQQKLNQLWCYNRIHGNGAKNLFVKNRKHTASDK